MAQLQKKFDGSIGKRVRSNSAAGEEKHEGCNGLFGRYHTAPFFSTKQERRTAFLIEIIVEASSNAVKQHTTAKVIGLRRLMPSRPNVAPAWAAIGPNGLSAVVSDVRTKPMH
jgi:hypothetical protein